jgi:AmmeMemoRadiSam system protein B
MSIVRRRQASVAGRWYSDDPAQLTAEVDRYVARAELDPIGGPVIAIVAPHAGLMYSGPVAAFAYKVASCSGCTTAVLVGPSHFVPFHGASIWPDGAWQTPLGDVVIDAELAHAIESAWSGLVHLPAAHGREHSLEMQLPFVARLLPGVPIVPIVMGHQTRETAFALASALEGAIAARDGRTLLIASSDLSHYEDAATAQALDAVVLRHIESLDPTALMGALEREPRHACGGGPMVSVLEAARRLGASSAHVLEYADSGDVSGDKSSVVGYMAAAIW